MQNQRRSIFIVIGGGESKHAQERMIISGIKLAAYLDVNLKIYIPDIRYLPSGRFTEKIRETPKFKIEFTAIGFEVESLSTVFSEVQSLDPVLMVIDRNQINLRLANKKSSLLKELIESIDVPSLLASFEKRTLMLPFYSLFVPISGERKMSSSLEWSIDFASKKNIPVDLLHVSDEQTQCQCDSSLLGDFSDQYYREYPHLVSGLIDKCSPYSSMAQKEAIRNFLHCGGSTLEQILKQSTMRKESLIVIEWKGKLATGHAEVLKGVLDQSDWPVLLTKEKKFEKPKLRIGKSYRVF